MKHSPVTVADLPARFIYDREVTMRLTPKCCVINCPEPSVRWIRIEPGSLAMELPLCDAHGDTFRSEAAAFTQTTAKRSSPKDPSGRGSE